MKKDTVIRQRPVSEKAYKSFVHRINAIALGYYERKEIIAALDRYLDGERDNYCRGLEKEYVLAFEMLRFEIDAAILRSARARQRADRRKNSDPTNHQEALSQTQETSTSESSEIVTEAKSNQDERVNDTETQKERVNKIAKICQKRMSHDTRNPRKQQHFHREKPKFMRTHMNI